MPSVDAFCRAMRRACNDWSLGYDQSNRWDYRDGGEVDCSSLVVCALKEAGFDVGGATYTGNMSSNLCARGWVRVANDGRPQRGDILLNDVNHVAVWLGDCLAQASIDENGNIKHGASGDQTGRETNTCGYYNYPWNCYLRYAGSSHLLNTASSRMDISLQAKSMSNGTLAAVSNNSDNAGDGSPMLYLSAWVSAGSIDVQARTESGGWLPSLKDPDDITDEESGAVGDGSPIKAIRMYYWSPNSDHAVFYRVKTESSGWLPWMMDHTDLGGSSDDFAGDGSTITNIEAYIAKAI